VAGRIEQLNHPQGSLSANNWKHGCDVTFDGNYQQQIHEEADLC
jgi:hypothetical protein